MATKHNKRTSNKGGPGSGRHPSGSGEMKRDLVNNGGKVADNMLKNEKSVLIKDFISNLSKETGYTKEEITKAIEGDKRVMERIAAQGYTLSPSRDPNNFVNIGGRNYGYIRSSKSLEGGKLMADKIRTSVLSKAKSNISKGNYDKGSWDASKLSIEDLKKWAVVIDDTKDPEKANAYKYPLGSGDKPNTKAISSAQGYAQTNMPTLASALKPVTEAIARQKLKATTKIEVKKYIISKAGIVIKDEAERIITSAVLVPGCKDCDFANGEDPLSEKQVADMAFSYMKHRIVDDSHDYNYSGKNRGLPVESWLLRQPMTVKTVTDETITYPKGTWMSSLKIEDDETWGLINDGTYKGLSVTAIDKEVADRLSSANKERVLIKDLKNPEAYTISVCKDPCVYQAQIISEVIKSDNNNINELIKDLNPSIKEGRVFSGANLNILTQIQVFIQRLIDLAKTESTDETNIDNSSNKEEADNIVIDIIKENIEIVNGVTKALTTIPTSQLDSKVTEDIANILNQFGILLMQMVNLIDDKIDEELSESPETEQAEG